MIGCVYVRLCEKTMGMLTRGQVKKLCDDFMKELNSCSGKYLDEGEQKYLESFRNENAKFSDTGELIISPEKLTKRSWWPLNTDEGGFFISSPYSISIPPGKFKTIKTELSIPVPDGYHGILYSRHCFKQATRKNLGYIPYSSCGLLFPWLREKNGIKIILHNYSDQLLKIKRGQTIAFVMFYKNLKYTFPEE